MLCLSSTLSKDLDSYPSFIVTEDEKEHWDAASVSTKVDMLDDNNTDSSRVKKQKREKKESPTCDDVRASLSAASVSSTTQRSAPIRRQGAVRLYFVLFFDFLLCDNNHSEYLCLRVSWILFILVGRGLFECPGKGRQQCSCTSSAAFRWHGRPSS